MSAEIQEQEQEFSMWGWAQPFRSRFLLFIFLGLCSVIWWLEMRRESERKAAQLEILQCLKGHSEAVERLKQEQINYIETFEKRYQELAREISRAEKRKK